jgi:hypothetical protein
MPGLTVTEKSHWRDRIFHTEHLQGKSLQRRGPTPYSGRNDVASTGTLVPGTA